MANTLNIENTRIIFPNFKGERTQYNRQGGRDFSIALDPEMAEDLQSQGFNVKWPKPNPDISPEEDRRLPYLTVTVSNDQHVNPSIRIFIVDSGNPSRVDVTNQMELEMLDRLDISSADVVINPYHWEIQEQDGVKTGIKAYLKALYLNLNTDPFAAKYGA